MFFTKNHEGQLVLDDHDPQYIIESLLSMTVAWNWHVKMCQSQKMALGHHQWYVALFYMW